MIAVLTFTDPRPTALSEERERALMEKHSGLVEELREEGFEVLDVNGRLGKYEALKAGRNFGVDSMEGGPLKPER